MLTRHEATSLQALATPRRPRVVSDLATSATPRRRASGHRHQCIDMADGGGKVAATQFIDPPRTVRDVARRIDDTAMAAASAARPLAFPDAGPARAGHGRPAVPLRATGARAAGRLVVAWSSLPPPPAATAPSGCAGSYRRHPASASPRDRARIREHPTTNMCDHEQQMRRRRSRRCGPWLSWLRFHAHAADPPVAVARNSTGRCRPARRHRRATGGTAPRPRHPAIDFPGLLAKPASRPPRACAEAVVDLRVVERGEVVPDRRRHAASNRQEGDRTCRIAPRPHRAALATAPAFAILVRRADDGATGGDKSRPSMRARSPAARVVRSVRRGAARARGAPMRCDARSPRLRQVRAGSADRAAALWSPTGLAFARQRRRPAPCA